MLSHESYAGIARKFDEFDSYGPECVRKFAEKAQILGDRSANKWQQDAFGQEQVWLRTLEQLSAPKDDPPTVASPLLAEKHSPGTPAFDQTRSFRSATADVCS